MLRLLAVAVPACLLALAWRPPAALVDRAIDRATDGRLRVTDLTGTVWEGHGVLAIADGRGSVRPVRQLEWRVAPQLAQAAMVITLWEHGLPQAHATVTAHGVELTISALDVPLRLITGASAHPVARAGWGGSLTLSSPGLRCDWSGSCFGRAELLWQDVTLAIVPDRPLGDHRITLDATGDTVTLQVATLRGEFRIDGQGALHTNGQGHFRAHLEGDPEIVDRLPNIMDHNARSTGTSGRVEFTLSIL